MFAHILSDSSTNINLTHGNAVKKKGHVRERNTVECWCNFYTSSAILDA